MSTNSSVNREPEAGMPAIDKYAFLCGYLEKTAADLSALIRNRPIVPPSKPGPASVTDPAPPVSTPGAKMTAAAPRAPVGSKTQAASPDTPAGKYPGRFIGNNFYPTGLVPFFGKIPTHTPGSRFYLSRRDLMNMVLPGNQGAQERFDSAVDYRKTVSEGMLQAFRQLYRLNQDEFTRPVPSQVYSQRKLPGTIGRSHIQYTSGATDQDPQTYLNINLTKGSGFGTYVHESGHTASTLGKPLKELSPEGRLIADASRYMYMGGDFVPEDSAVKEVASQFFTLKLYLENLGVDTRDPAQVKQVLRNSDRYLDNMDPKGRRQGGDRSFRRLHDYLNKLSEEDPGKREDTIEAIGDFFPGIADTGSGTKDVHSPEALYGDGPSMVV